MVYGELLLSAPQVSIYSGILHDPVVTLVLKLIDQADEHRSGMSATGAELFNRLAESAELSVEPLVGNAWQNYLLEAIISDDNVFARKAERCEVEGMGTSLLTQTRFDLHVLRSLYDLDFAVLCDSLPSFDGFSPFESGRSDEARLLIKTQMHQTSDWRDALSTLAGFYSRTGTGEFGRFKAFRWIGDVDGGHLHGVESPDPITLADLVEYDWQRESVRRNTEKLLAGFATNNMILYGDRGTGKSSTVKAMLNEFADKKLRLVEVAKENLVELPTILAILRKRPEKFILFLDDLSFEEDETQYKAMKAVLEGGLEARPANVVLYATSNRRNLIRERFSDRSGSDEVHPGDTMQEKLSLSDRFGLKVPFLAPDPEEYLRMVSVLAERSGITMTADLRKKAVAWQHARSGRSARQFVDYILGEIALGQG